MGNKRKRGIIESGKQIKREREVKRNLFVGREREVTGEWVGVRERERE